VNVHKSSGSDDALIGSFAVVQCHIPTTASLQLESSYGRHMTRFSPASRGLGCCGCLHIRYAFWYYTGHMVRQTKNTCIKTTHGPSLQEIAQRIQRPRHLKRLPSSGLGSVEEAGLFEGSGCHFLGLLPQSLLLGLM